MKLFVVFGLVVACAAVSMGHGHGGHGGSSYANSNSVAHSSGGHGGGGGGHGGGHDESHDYYAHPEYKFEYGVADLHTGDKKSQWEHRDGDVVKGGYTFAEADGTKRVVEYTSDKHNGFNAVVKRIGHASHPAVYGHGGDGGGHGGSGGDGGAGGHGGGSGHGGAGGHGLSHGYFH